MLPIYRVTVSRCLVLHSPKTYYTVDVEASERADAISLAFQEVKRVYGEKPGLLAIETITPKNETYGDR